MRVARILLLVALAASAHAQDAQEWFNKAVYSTNPDEQIHYYSKALDADPQYFQAMHNLAGVYYRKGLMRKAISSYESLIRNGRAYYQTFYNLACCYARVGDNQHALKALKRAFQKGFKDATLIARDEDLIEVRADPEYARIAAAYLKGAKRRGPSPALREELGEGAVEDIAAAPRPKKVRKAKPIRAKRVETVDEAPLARIDPVPAESAKPPRPIGKAAASAELGATAVKGR